MKLRPFYLSFSFSWAKLWVLIFYPLNFEMTNAICLTYITAYAKSGKKMAKITSFFL